MTLSDHGTALLLTVGGSAAPECTAIRIGISNEPSQQRLPEKTFFDTNFSGQVQICVSAEEYWKIEPDRSRTNDILICTHNDDITRHVRLIGRDHVISVNLFTYWSLGREQAMFSLRRDFKRHPTRIQVRIIPGVADLQKHIKRAQSHNEPVLILNAPRLFQIGV